MAFVPVAGVFFDDALRIFGDAIDTFKLRRIFGRNGRATVGIAKRLDYAATFFEAFPTLRGRVAHVHHAVERQVLTRYPGVFTELELHSIQNLRGIAMGDAVTHLSTIRRLWDEFYFAHPDSATRQQLLDWATHIDDTLGSRFLPPVRRN